MLPEQMVSYLDKNFTCDEIKSAMDGMDSLKAPGRDNFSVAFYQKNWGTVRKKVTSLCLEVLNKGKCLKDINSMVITRISKVQKPTNPGDYRLISLCNFPYKIITKAMKNRLNGVLREIFSET
ncbi:hypothetical protein Ddye_010329 [Dipteronia dyeriana]|uniref:Reverse transcriptase n=1 Tax=Dipteronia dyeriana TaxID=168575 RepID=A0AAD9XDG0_9ROSI|nr:hypothetical protein Ddye_010329 [Dipteronia dyeriana]